MITTIETSKINENIKTKYLVNAIFCKTVDNKMLTRCFGSIVNINRHSCIKGSQSLDRKHATINIKPKSGLKKNIKGCKIVDQHHN
jgi:hypothetical protein